MIQTRKKEKLKWSFLIYVQWLKLIKQFHSLQIQFEKKKNAFLFQSLKKCSSQHSNRKSLILKDYPTKRRVILRDAIPISLKNNNKTRIVAHRAYAIKRFIWISLLLHIKLVDRPDLKISIHLKKKLMVFDLKWLNDLAATKWMQNKKKKNWTWMLKK